MTRADISNELHCLEAELIQIYGKRPIRDRKGTYSLQAEGQNIQFGVYGESWAVGWEYCSDCDNRLVFSVADDKLMKIKEEEERREYR